MTPYYIDTPPWTDTCGGAKIMHYLAALLLAAGCPVSTKEPCFYNPSISVIPECPSESVVVYPEGHGPDNRLHGKKVVRYFLYFASSYYKAQVPKEECAIVFHRDYLEDVQKACPYQTLTEDDVVLLPGLEAEWCFPEPKDTYWAIENLFYRGKGEDKRPEVKCDDLPRESHAKTLAILRRTKNFYTADPHTIMSREAALCGCNVFVLRGGIFTPETNVLEIAQSLVMNPHQDVALAKKFDRLVCKFFGLELSKEEPKVCPTCGGKGSVAQNLLCHDGGNAVGFKKCPDCA
jgi:hypothetical protein